jgi:hypothetical protein
MSSRNSVAAGATVAILLLSPPSHAAETPAEQQSVAELRDTVINLLQALVDKGLLTREQAQQLVKQAQDRAASDAAATAAKNAEQEKDEQNAVRVPYVPQIVKDEISKQVAAEVQPAVVASVVQEAKAEKWGVPAALPDWLSRVRVFGDLTLRYQGDWFPSDNSTNEILNFDAINQAGGLAKTTFPFVDTTENRNRMRERARIGVEGDLSPNVTAYIRLATGSLTDNAASESQTLGTYSERYSAGFDQAFLVWNSNRVGQLSLDTAEGGRMANPWFSPTELVYSRDLTFEGIADTLRLGWGDGASDRSHVYATVGAFPVLEVPLENSQNKWLLGAQVGTNLRFNDADEHLRIAAAYYDFDHITGVPNTPNSTLTNFTAPAYVQYGNTMFDIANDTIDPAGTVNLFALAAHFRLVDAAATFDAAVGSHTLSITGEAVRNIGYDRNTIEALTGQSIDKNNDMGYVGEISFGDATVDEFAKWRGAFGYRYVMSDAVVDAWTDADFHEGGTNAKGYYIWTQFGLTHNTWARLRYMSSNEVSGPRYGLDILQFDVSARF